MLTRIVSIFLFLGIYSGEEWQAYNNKVSFSFIYFWSTIQLGLAIVCGCLPTLGPLLRALSEWVSYLRELYSSIRLYISPGSVVTQSPHTATPNDTNQPWVQAGEGRVNASSWTWAYRSDGDESDYALQPIPSTTILVNREVDIA